MAGPDRRATVMARLDRAISGNAMDRVMERQADSMTSTM
jgi:hypothetical protein